MARDNNGKELPKGITLRSDGRYMGRFRYNGQDFTVYDYEIKKAVKKLSELRYEVEHGIYSKESDIILDDWFIIWLRDFKEKSVKPGTREVYKNTYNGCIKKVLGKKRLKDIRLEHVQKLYNDMSEKYAEGTIRLANVILYGLFQQAIKVQLIVNNPIQLATIPRARKRKQRTVLTEEEQKLFLDYAKKHSRLYPVFAFALLTGCRNGEVRGLEWKNVDFENKLIHITGTLKYVKGMGIYKGSPKSETARRDIPMLDACSQLLMQCAEEQRAARELAGELWEPLGGLEDLVFTQSNGHPIGRESVSFELVKLIGEMRKGGCEIENFTFHSLRHTFATRALENGISMKTLQAILGHAQYAMTADLYSHVLPDTKAREMNKLSRLFTDKGESEAKENVQLDKCAL